MSNNKHRTSKTKGRKRINYDETLVRFLRFSLIPNWRKDSIEKYDEKCDITGDQFDVVHHLYPCELILSETLQCLNLPKYKKIKEYSKVEIDKIKEKFIELNYDYGLGVCLTNEIHNEFHRIMGLNAKEQDYKLYKHYKINNLDLKEIEKCNLLGRGNLYNKTIRIQVDEMKFILEQDIKYDYKKILFFMMLFSRLYAKNNVFYISQYKLADLINSGIDKVRSGLKTLESKELIKIYNRKDVYKDLDIDFRRMTHMYELVNLNNTAENYIPINCNDIDDINFNDIVFSFVDKGFITVEYLRNVLNKYDYYNNNIPKMKTSQQ